MATENEQSVVSPGSHAEQSSSVIAQWAHGWEQRLRQDAMDDVRERYRQKATLKHNSRGHSGALDS